MFQATSWGFDGASGLEWRDESVMQFYSCPTFFTVRLFQSNRPITKEVKKIVGNAFISGNISSQVGGKFQHMSRLLERALCTFLCNFHIAHNHVSFSMGGTGYKESVIMRCPPNTGARDFWLIFTLMLKCVRDELWKNGEKIHPYIYNSNGQNVRMIEWEKCWDEVQEGKNSTMLRLRSIGTELHWILTLSLSKKSSQEFRLNVKPPPEKEASNMNKSLLSKLLLQKYGN